MATKKEKRLAEISKALNLVAEHDAITSRMSIEIRFKFDEDGELPDNIDKLFSIARFTDGIDVELEYGMLVFHFGRVKN